MIFFASTFWNISWWNGFHHPLSDGHLHYSKGGGGRRTIGTAVLIRINMRGTERMVVTFVNSWRKTLRKCMLSNDKFQQTCCVMQLNWQDVLLQIWRIRSFDVYIALHLYSVSLLCVENIEICEIEWLINSTILNQASIKHGSFASCVNR